MKGTLAAHADTGSVPNIQLVLKENTPFSLGYLFFFFMKVCAMSAYLLEINPFNQPGVEVYKKNMFQLLGKK
jgi:glucose-6-phosphate isomerase